MLLTFYGVRGSCPCAGPAYRKVGGNTSCSLVSVDGEPPLVLDLGTGLRALGEVLGARARAEGRPVRASALLTHLHFDHILGLPFFSPLHEPGSHLTIFGPHQAPDHLRETLAGAVQPPFFPVEMVDFEGDIDVHELPGDGSAVEIGSITVHARHVPHPGTTLGFRVEAEGRSLAYLPDHQAPPDRREVDEDVRSLCAGVDVLVHDGQFDDEEFVTKRDWGHSTVAYAVRVAASCGARRLVLFHHDPSHTDRRVGALLRSARRLPDAHGLEEICVATEGASLSV